MPQRNTDPEVKGRNDCPTAGEVTTLFTACLEQRNNEIPVFAGDIVVANNCCIVFRWKVGGSQLPWKG